MTTPDTVYDYNMATREHIPAQAPVLGDFNSANYVTERRTAGAPDGTEIPVSLVYRKGRKLDGSAPRMAGRLWRVWSSKRRLFLVEAAKPTDRGVI